MYRGAYSTFENVLPQVAIATPYEGEVFQSAQLISIVANATDSDGSISYVDFYVNDELLMRDLEAPYMLELQNLEIGNYTCYAMTYDNFMQNSESVPVNFTITDEASQNEKITINPSLGDSQC